MLKRVCTMVMVLVLLAAQAVPAVAGEAVLHSRASDDEWGVEGIAAGQVPEDVQLESEAALMSSMTRLPLYFVENEGQADERVRYYVQGKDKTLYFTSQGLTFVLSGEDDERWVAKLDFVGANPNVQPVGLDETGAVVSYFKGRPEEWVTGLKTYSAVVYRDLWPGIDLQYTGTVNRLKYQFVVEPGADPSQIKLAYRGADIAVNESGQLEVNTPGGGFEDGAPYAYQQAAGGGQVEVEVCYELGETLGVSETPRVYGFRVGTYDRSRVLVLDPVVLFSCGYIGGNLDDIGRSIAVDSEGNAYITGGAASTETSFPDAVGPDGTYNGGTHDAFVAKIRAGGGSLVYCGYIGGSSVDIGSGIAVDGSGCAYVTGSTYSTQATFPVTIGPDLSHNVSEDAFVAKVSADGTALEYCGYIGGRSVDAGHAIAVDGLGQAYIGGRTYSNETSDAFPVLVGPTLYYNSSGDGFVAKVSDDGSGLLYCGYIGGSDHDWIDDIALDGSGRAYVTGLAHSGETSFPATVGPDMTHNGSSDAFVARVRANGAGLEYCGYIGGASYDSGSGIAVDSDGNCYVTGQTGSSYADGFPLVEGPDLTYNGTGDGFVAKVSTAGTTLAYCGYIGGSDEDSAHGIAVDPSGNAYIVGWTQSSEADGFPVTQGPDLTYNGGTGEEGDAFVAKLRADGSWFDYCSYIGGLRGDSATDVALQQVGADYTAHIVGYTLSTQSDGFPVTVGPDLSHNGYEDTFVARIGPNHAPTLGSIDPVNGSSAPGAPFYVTTSFVDADGWRDLKHVYFHIGDSPSLVGNVTLMYNRAKHKLWIRSDDGLSWQGGCSPTQMTVIGNSQAQLYCANTYVSYSGTDTMNVGWYMWFMPGYEGEKKTGLKCKDMHKAKAKGKWKGTWTIE